MSAPVGDFDTALGLFAVVALAFCLSRCLLLANATSGVPLFDLHAMLASNFAFGFLAVFILAIPALFGLPPRMQ